MKREISLFSKDLTPCENRGFSLLENCMRTILKNEPVQSVTMAGEGCSGEYCHATIKAEVTKRGACLWVLVKMLSRSGVRAI